MRIPSLTIDRDLAARAAKKAFRRARAAGKPIKWSQAKAIGKATARIKIAQPKWPNEEQRKELHVKSSARPLQFPRYKRDPRGEWWMQKLADLVESRRHTTVPAYSPRNGRRIKARGKRAERTVKREGYTEPEKTE